jgi:Phosphotransferase enzyme family
MVFPTTSGMRVELCTDGDGRQVIVKYPRPGAPPVVAESLAAQARQLEVLRSCCPRAPFPAVLEATRERLLLAYVPGVTVRDGRELLGTARRQRLLTAAVATVFQLAARGPDERGGHHQAPAGSGFLAAELRRRLRRLDTAVRELRRGPELASALARDEGGAVLRGLHDADRSGQLERIDHELAPPYLGFGIHGDFTPQNIVYDPASTAAPELTFIDPRGMVRWHGGLPWWDPVFDLAAAVVFDGVIDPMVAPGVSGHPGGAALAAGLDSTRAALVGCAADPRAQDWIGTDPCWLRRLDFAILARLLGNIAVQAEHGGDDGVGRAALVYAVTCRWYRRIWPDTGRLGR